MAGSTSCMLSRVSMAFFGARGIVQQGRQFVPQLIFVGQIQLVFAHEEAVGYPLRRELHDQIVLVGPQDDAHGLGIATATDFRFEVVQIHVHLPDVLVPDHAALEVDENEALEQEIVEHEIDTARMLRVEGGDAVLAGDKRKPAAQFEKEIAQVRDKRRMEPPFLQALGNRNSGKLEDVRIAEHVFGLPHLDAFVRQGQHPGLVAGKRDAVEQHGLHLPPEFADAPFRGFALLHVERDFQRVVGTEDFKVVAPCQKSGRLDFAGNSRHLDFLRSQVELAHVMQVRMREAAPQPEGEVAGKVPHQTIPVNSTVRAIQFVFHDVFARPPIGWRSWPP